VSFRRKLLATFALAVFVAVAAVSAIDSLLARRAFERADSERTAALIAQFRREFDRRGQEVVRRVAAISESDSAAAIALELSRPSPSVGSFINQAKVDAQAQGLEFLEYVDTAGTIISSAQAPAKFGYKELLIGGASTALPSGAFLKTEDMPAAIGLFALRPVRVADTTLYVLGGERLDRDFLGALELPGIARVMLYSHLQPQFSPELLADKTGVVRDGGKLQPLVESVLAHGDEEAQTVAWSADSSDSDAVHALPLRGPEGNTVGVLLVANSRRPLLELERNITSIALAAGSGGIILAILLSGWSAARVTRPVEEIAAAAQRVALGDWNVRVDATSQDELGQLADSFNQMTRELLDQKQRLVQAERVAAWRELARRLAHELKNPLFPLQITVENLLRAHERSPELFEEIFRESASTLLAEIANLKTIIGRFSEFSKMPQPQLQAVDINEAVCRAAKVFQAQLQDRSRIDCHLELEPASPTIDADPELLHRALSNLVLNALDAMPEGGTLKLSTRSIGGRVLIKVSDTGAGLTREECERLFTPYYTTKQHGTGLGLAIVQSVVSDHHGSIAVESAPGQGTTFVIELPAGTSSPQVTEAAASRENA
jgi:two-component system, NtrC family, nitrogen regulation sensor histidine kinase NtrY